MNSAANLARFEVLVLSLLLLISNAHLLSALPAQRTDSEVEHWMEAWRDEIRGLADPVPQLLISLPRLDWYQLLTTTEIHLLRDPLNPDAQSIDLVELSPYIPSAFRKRSSVEGVLILAHYDPLGREYPPKIGNSFSRRESIESDRRKFFWSKRQPAPTDVYPTLFMSELLDTTISLSLKMSDQFRQTEERQAWPVPSNPPYLQP